MWFVLFKFSLSFMRSTVKTKNLAVIPVNKSKTGRVSLDSLLFFFKVYLFLLLLFFFLLFVSFR